MDVVFRVDLVEAKSEWVIVCESSAGGKVVHQIDNPFADAELETLLEKVETPLLSHLRDLSHQSRRTSGELPGQPSRPGQPQPGFRPPPVPQQFWSQPLVIVGIVVGGFFLLFMFLAFLGALAGY